MTNEPIIYLGPSLPRLEAQQLLIGDYRPPIRRGDLPAHGTDSTIIIIDGEFGQTLPVSPKEILRLLDQGTRVIGASSMGALRAAELHSCGMEGFGWVFEAYRSGKIIRDDEVAVMYSPFDFRPMTVALVNIRYSTERLLRRGQLDSLGARRILRMAQQIFFADRTPVRLRHELVGILSAAVLDELTDAAFLGRADIKAADARLALTKVSCEQTQCIHGGFRPCLPNQNLTKNNPRKDLAAKLKQSPLTLSNQVERLVS
jgi:hypothetical protein